MPRFEIEQKYRIKNPALVRAKLKSLGAKRQSSGLETDLFLDSDRFLLKKKSVLRLRRSPGGAFLTFKGPRLKSRYKKRVELEAPVNFKLVTEILSQLGYQVAARLQKRRETYRLSGLVITLDHLQGIGWFLELEGRPSAIAKMARELALSEREERSYLEMKLSDQRWR